MRGIGKGERKRGCMESNHVRGDSARQILQRWGVKGVKAAGVGEETESRLHCVRVAEEVDGASRACAHGRALGQHTVERR